MKTEELPIEKVFPNPDQPRKLFPKASLVDLAASITQNGLMQPITVVPRGEGWMIVMGERRWRACRLAKRETVTAFVRHELTEAALAEQALVENLLREDLNIVDEARAYQTFVDRGYAIETLANVLGFQNSRRIVDRLKLLRLDPSLLAGVEKGAISPAQGLEMSRLSVAGQYTFWEAIQAGKCPTYSAMHRTASAIYDRENQRDLFKADLTKEEKAALSKVDYFVTHASRLLTFFTAEDLAVMHQVQKSNARTCAEQLGLLEKLCRDLRNALLVNATKQELAG